MPIDGIVFDFDYTLASLKLIDFIGHPRAISPFVNMKQACDRHRGFRKLNLPTMIHESLADHSDVERFTRYSRQLYTPRHVRGIIHDVIAACDEQNIPRAVLSDHPCMHKLHSIALHDGWSAVVHCQTYGALKPLPDALHAVAAQLDIPMNTLVLVGDRWDSDGLMACAAGAQFVHIEHLENLLQRIRNKG